MSDTAIDLGTTPASTPSGGNPDAAAADQVLKAKHRAVWASGDYPHLGRILWELGGVLVGALDVRPGQRVLDVAAGTGNAASRAALAGADVVASDLTPELLTAGRAEAEKEGVTLKWEVADAEHLPFADASFDTVMSCIGVMFAPHHQASADELLRVVRPGGRVGLLSWTPAGLVGQLFATMKPFAPPPPAGAQPPPLWGDEEHVRALLGDRVTDVVCERRSIRVDYFTSGRAYREYFSTMYGPTIATYKFNADDPEKVAALDTAIEELADRFGASAGAFDWEYLLLTARRA